MCIRDRFKHSNYYDYSKNKKITTQLQQNIGSAGQLSLTSDWINYMDVEDAQQFRLSYSLPIYNLSTSLSLNYNKQPQYANADKSVYLSMSLPFSSFSNYSNTSLTTSIYNSGNSTNTQMGITGSLLDQKLYYSLMEGHHSGDQDSNSGNATLRYKSAKGELQSTLSHQKNGKQLQLGANGGIVVHSKGIVFSQSLSLDGASALIDTNGIDNIKVKRGIGISTDRNGYAVVPYLTPYRKNPIALDVNRVSTDTEIITSDLTVTPSRGALVSAKFNVVSGHKALISLVRENGDFVPFGAIASFSESKTKKNVTGIVSNSGQVWMSGLPDKGEIFVKWGDDNQSQCKAPFELKNSQSVITRLSLVCR